MFYFLFEIYWKEFCVLLFKMSVVEILIIDCIEFRFILDLFSFLFIRIVMPFKPPEVVKCKLAQKQLSFIEEISFS